MSDARYADSVGHTPVICAHPEVGLIWRGWTLIRICAICDQEFGPVGTLPNGSSGTADG